MVASLGVRRFALLGGLVAGAGASALIWSNADDEGLGYATRDADSIAGRGLQQRADAALCGYIDEEALSCRSGQVCSVDHGNKVIGCCPKSNPRCTIAQSCANEDSLGGLSGRDKRDTKVLTCGSGLLTPSCYAYSYSGGPYDGYSMYACLSDLFFTSVSISMNQQLDTDNQPTTTKPSTTTQPTTIATTKQSPTTNQSTRPSTTRPVVQTSKNDGTTSTTDPTSTTADGTSLSTATDTTSTSAPTSSTSSGPSATGVSGAVEGSTVAGGTNTGAIVGGVLGAIAFILLCVAAVMYFLWWRRKRREESTYNPSMAYTGDNSGFNQDRSGSALRGNIPSHPNMAGGPWTFSQYSPGGAAYGAGAGAAAGAGATRAAPATSQDPGHGYFGKTADDTGVSPISSPVSPPDSPIQGTRSPPRPVSPPQTYSRHNPPPPEQFRAYRPYEGT